MLRFASDFLCLLKHQELNIAGIPYATITLKRKVKLNPVKKSSTNSV